MTTPRRVYLDHSATTPVRPEVLDAMLPFFAESFGNASSAHAPGQFARNAVRRSREAVAAAIGCSPEEIVFTSGGTEADNLAVEGVSRARRNSGRHILTSAIEHPAVRECCRTLARDGYEISEIPVDGHGRIDLDQARAGIRPDTILVSAMLANNETGTIQPVAGIAEAARGRGALVHTDAVQATGKIPINVNDLAVDLLSLSAHKIGGPKGVGALYVRKEVKIARLQQGGHQEMDRRAGTENVPGIVGFGRAMELAVTEQADFARRATALRDALQAGILAAVPAARLNGPLDGRLPNVLNISFAGLDGRAIALALDAKGVAVSTGAACSSGVADPSHVLTAMGLSPALARGAIRFSLGPSTTAEEIEYVVGSVLEAETSVRRTTA